jgi:hypothetical protein
MILDDSLDLGQTYRIERRAWLGPDNYDLVTPLGSAEYMIAHADFPAAATKLHLYPSGHMPYLGNDARRKPLPVSASA